MNGASVFGWIKTLALIAVAVTLAILAAKVAAWLKAKGVMGTAQALKDETPLGIPARGIDFVVEAATGRDGETLGGWLAEMLDPATRRANAEMTQARRVKPVVVANDIDAELRAGSPYIWNETDTELRRIYH